MHDAPVAADEKKPVLGLNKKLLLISSWAPPKIGGAQNLYAVFSHINPTDYSILNSHRNFEAANGEFGATLEGEYFFYDRRTGHAAPVTRTLKRRMQYVKRFPGIFRVLRTISSLVRSFTVSLRLVVKIRRDGATIVRDKKIDLLVGLSDTETNLVSTYLLSRRTRTPYALYLFDLYYGNRLSFPYSVLAKIMEPIIFKNAAHIFVTNEATKEYYVRKYGDEKKYSVIYNSASPEEYQLHSPLVTLNANTRLHIVFTGNIYWAQETALHDLLSLLASSTTLDADLTVYCPTIPRALLKEYEDTKNIKFASAPQSRMARIQSEAGILFLPLSWNTEAVDIIKTASPGKLTDYLIAGRPILIHAPAYSFVAKYAKENDFAEVVDREDPVMLAAAIRRLATDTAHAARLVTNAQKTFYKNHDPYANAKNLCTILNNLS